MLIRKLIIAVMAIAAPAVWGQSTSTQPHIGYIYPAGGQQGTTVHVTVGGQYLRSINNIHFSGQGVTAKVISRGRVLRNINSDQKKELQRQMKEVREMRLSELTVQKPKPEKSPDKKKQADKNNPEVKLPPSPLLYDLENKSLRELEHIKNILLFPRTKLQLNRQLTELILIEIKIAPDAKPGNREMRLQTSNSMTNPVIFQVGLLKETMELEPNDNMAYPEIRDLPQLPPGKPLQLPIVLNGQIMPGDVDRFRFEAKKGQELVIETHARSLIPYLADAVPGWFQAAVSLYDNKGNEVAFADDYRFNPDPVLFYKIPGDGLYEIAIHDSIYRGREDFIYRVSIGETPFITRAFPLGGKSNSKTTASIDGYNLPEKTLDLNTRTDRGIRRTAYYDEKQISNSIPYAVDILPESTEAESNNSTEKAQKITLPHILNGIIEGAGDVDIYRFEGKKGDKVVTEVLARRLNSPLDSTVRLIDTSGKVISWNDDHVIKDTYLHKDITGLITHHADSYMISELPQDGTYYVQISDSQRHGGKAYGYRLRISAPQPDFSLRITPSSLFVTVGGIVPFDVHVLRKDGFDGPITVMPKDKKDGFSVKGGVIPPGCNHIRMTLTAPAKGPENVDLQLVGHGQMGDRVIRRPAVPAEDMMQAFLYRHLVPSQEFLVHLKKSKWPIPRVELKGDSVVSIEPGDFVKIVLKTPKRAILKELKLQMIDAPEGLTIHDTTVVDEGLQFMLRADRDKIKSGFTDNLIIETIREYYPTDKNGKVSKELRRYSAGFLPAIPVRVGDQKLAKQ